MAKRPLPSIETLRQLFRYNPETGKLYWIKDRKRAFTSVSSHGYHCAVVNYKYLYAHRVAWAITHGEWPSELIDHRDGDRKNNKIKNLRAANHLQNRVNGKTWSKSGVKGVRLLPSGKWLATFCSKGKLRSLGVFSTRDAASSAYLAKATELYGEFAKG